MSSPYILWVNNEGRLLLTSVAPGVDRLAVIPSLVPRGKPYWLVEHGELPPMDDYEAWVVDLDEVRTPDGYGAQL